MQRNAITIAAAALAVFVTLPTTARARPPVIVSDGRAAYLPITPCRLADTRVAGSPSFTRLDATTLRIQVTGRCGVDRAITAVAISATVTNTARDGFAAVTPAGTAGQTSTVNWTAGETRAASTVVAVSADGAVDVSVSSGLQAAAVVIDVTGAWMPVAGTVTAGRFVTIETHRVLDTREGLGRVAAGGIVSMDRETMGLPADAVAVSGTLTSTGGDGAGYLTAFPAGGAAPMTSNVNTDGAHQDRAAGVIVALGGGGLSVLSGGSSADIVFDVTGYVTGPSAQRSLDGLLVPIVPTRILDTRTSASPVTVSAVADASTLAANADISGVVATVTATDARASGFASIGSAAVTSVLNWPGGRGAVAAMTVQTLDSGGELQLTGSSPAVFIIDVTAYLLGDPAASGHTPPATGPVTDALTTGSIRDGTGTGKPTGDPLALLHQTYTPAELAAGGGVSIVFADPPGGVPAMVPYDATSFSACGPEPLCMLLSPSHWANPGRDPIDSNRVMVSHEWAHVLSFRYQKYLQGDDRSRWIDRELAVNEECLADTAASLVLARGSFPGNETADYVVHYMCDEYWAARYGADHVEQMRSEAINVATGLLDWAGKWGAAHPA